MLKEWKLVAAEAAGAARRGRFDDEHSREQVAAYLTRRSLASDERNERALARWNDHLRIQWEIEHLGASTRVVAVPRSGSRRPR
jgi:hypothetical protein